MALSQSAMNNYLNGVEALKSVEAKELEYLWLPYLPKADLCLLVGDGGTGKSHLALAMAQAVAGNPANGEIPGEIMGYGNVLYCSQEINAGIAKGFLSGLETENVYFYDNAKQTPLFLYNVDAIEYLITNLKLKLIIFDPITSFTGDLDLNKDRYCRQVLDPPRRLAQRHEVTFLFLAHNNKGEHAEKADNAISGSKQLVNACRAVLQCGFRDKRYPSLRAAALSKVNGKSGAAIAFEIDSQTGDFTWDGECLISAEELRKIRPPQAFVTDIEPTMGEKDELIRLIVNQVESHGGKWETTSAEITETAKRNDGYKKLSLKNEIQIGRLLKKIVIDLDQEGINFGEVKRNDNRTKVFKRCSNGNL